MKSLTIVYVTSRKEPKIEWFFSSLARQYTTWDQPMDIVVVDHFAYDSVRVQDFRDIKFLDKFYILSYTHFKHVLPKPTIWQGTHRLTKEDWWAKSNALNTGICLCETEWIAFVDDRSVLAPGWLDAVERAMNGNYAVCGSYEKWANLVVDNGRPSGGEMLGEDTRRPGLYPFDSFYGGSAALPLEWCLQLNGYPELVDGAGTEDSMFGVLLKNNGYPIFYDSDMRLIEDRTPGQIDGALKRADKNPHLGQQAKSWAIVRLFKDKLTSQNEFDIRNIRDRVILNSESLDSIGPFGPYVDFYDGQPISEMI